MAMPIKRPSPLPILPDPPANRTWHESRGWINRDDPGVETYYMRPDRSRISPFIVGITISVFAVIAFTIFEPNIRRWIESFVPETQLLESH